MTSLQITVEDLGPCQKKVRVRVPPERIREEIENGIKNAGRYLKVPGFRPGHIPRQIVEQRYGDAIRREVKETLVQDAYREALQEKQLVPLTSPEIPLDKLTLEEQKALEFEVSIDVRPTIELKKYKGVGAKREKVSVAASEIDDQIKNLRASRRRPVSDPEGKLAEEGFAVCSIEFFEGKDSILKRDAVRISSVTPVVGTDPKKFEKALLGKKVGESIELDLKYPEDFEVETARGKSGKVKLVVSDIYKLIEPTDEEMLKTFDFPDLDTLKKETEKTILSHKEEQESRRIEDKIIDELIEAHQFELPQRVVDDQAESALSRFRSLREGAGIKGEALAAEVAAQQSKTRETAVKQCKGFFLIEAIARKEKLFVTDEELIAELQGIADRNQTPVKEVVQYYQQQNLIPMLRIELMEKKVRKFLVENAKIS